MLGRAGLLQVIAYIRAGHRPAEQEALGLVAADHAHALQLVLRRNAFGSPARAQRVTELRDVVEDGIGLKTVVGHIRPVDLDLVERRFAQIVQRGIAGSKIVQRHSHAERANLAQESGALTASTRLAANRSRLSARAV
jgi:hypothetical protein